MKWGPFLALALVTAACTSRAELQSAQEVAAAAEGRVTDLEAELGGNAADLSSAQATVLALDATNAQLKADLEQTRSEERQASSEASRLADEVEKYLCDSQITDMKYDGVMDASTILAAWFTRQPDTEAVHTPYRDKIWNNALSQLHGITYTSKADHEQYVEHFMVYFDEFGFTPSVFWIGGQCWLDAP